MGADQATPAPTATRLSAFLREIRSSKPSTASSFFEGLPPNVTEVAGWCHLAEAVGSLRRPFPVSP